MSRHIIFLNGPPGSGKDEVGSILEAHGLRAVKCFKAAAPIKCAVQSFLGISARTGETLKEAALRDIQSTIDSPITLREFYIRFSESFIKPLLGEATFGHMLGTSIRLHAPPVAVVTDSGFLPEIAACIQHTRPIGYTPHVWQLFRKGCDFKEDSRSYLNVLDLLPLGIDAVTRIENNGSIDDLRETVISHYRLIGV
jgi:hypothetical protein